MSQKEDDQHFAAPAISTDAYLFFFTAQDRSPMPSCECCCAGQASEAEGVKRDVQDL